MTTSTNIHAQRAILDGQKLEAVNQKLQAEIDSGKIPGINYLIAHKGNIIYRKGLGFMDLEEQKPILPETLFRVFSLTKPVTTVAVLQLMEAGMLELDDPVTKFVPELKKLKVWTENGLVDLERPMTIRHLLTHRSGFGYSQLKGHPVSEKCRAYFEANKYSTNVDFTETIKGIGEIPLYQQPGKEFLYGFSTDLLGGIVERLSGKLFRDYLQEHVFEPLGMTDAHFYIPPEKRQFFSKSYAQSRKGKGLVEMPEDFTLRYFSKDKGMRGGDGLACTIDDYFKFAQMILNDGELKGVSILQKSSVQLMKSPQMPAALDIPFLKGAGFSFGFAVFTHPERHDFPCSKGGLCWSGFGHTTCWIDPSHETILLAFAQLFPFGYTPIFTDLRRGISEAMVFRGK